MISGRIYKELTEICLLDQVYVAEVAKANGANVTIKGFVRYETGEGIEKKEEDFAAEVAKQMGM